MFEASEELLARLRSEDAEVQTEAAYEFLYGQHNAEELRLEDVNAVADNGLKAYPKQVDFFFDGLNDIMQWRQAVAWWPKHKDLPPALACPTVWMLCSNYLESDPRIGDTFIARLTLQAGKVMQWASDHKLNPANPDETKEERRARLNRERVARHRQAKQLAPKDPRVAAIAEAYAALQEGRRQKREAIRQWDGHLAGLERRWVELKNELKS